MNEKKAKANAAKFTPGSIHVAVLTSNVAGSWYVTALLTMSAALEFQRELAQAIEQAAANTTLVAKEGESGAM